MMKTKAILALLTLCIASIGAQAKTLTIGIDLSGSNPLLSHKNFAAAASRHVTREILKLKHGDVVDVKTFGSRADALNLLNHQFVIKRRMKPHRVSKIIAQYIQSLPSNTELSQSSTYLAAFLEFGNFDCENKGHIFILTDGLESSSYVEGTEMLEGKKGLPEPDANLKGCTMTMYGLGAGMNPQSVKFIRNEWRTWSEKAGAAFTAIIP